jgi:hypothetical protein
MSVRTPFSQKTGPSFMADSSRFCGICGYFWPRRLKPTLETDGEVYPIYSEDFNVKGFDLCEVFPFLAGLWALLLQEVFVCNF